jgi:hypothetical protein
MISHNSINIYSLTRLCPSQDRPRQPDPVAPVILLHVTFTAYLGAWQMLLSILLCIKWTDGWVVINLNTASFLEIAVVEWCLPATFILRNSKP